MASGGSSQVGPRPTRAFRLVLEYVTTIGPGCSTEVGKATGIGQPHASRVLNSLYRQHGLLERDKAPIGRRVFFTATPAAYLLAAEWREHDAAR